MNPAQNVISDELIRLFSPRSRKRYPHILRLVTIETETGKRLQFLTNHMTLAASTISEIYKYRWQIEVFFKLLKQNLKIKSFIGGSPNALWTQGVTEGPNSDIVRNPTVCRLRRMDNGFS